MSNPEQNTKQTEPISAFIHLRDRIKQHYLYWPALKGDGEPVLLLHGFTNDAHIWDSLAHKLVKQRPVYALDFRGHGDSDWDPYANYTHDTLVEDLHETVTQLGLKEFSIVAHSLGARVAILYHQKYSPALTAMVIVDTGPEVRAAGVNKVRMDAEAMPTQFDSIEAYTDHLASIYMLAKRDHVASLAQNGLRALPNGRYEVKTDPAFTKALWNPDSYHKNASDLRMPLNDQLWLALSTLNAPTLLLRGQISAILSRKVADKMAHQVIPNAHLRVIAGAGHAVLVDQPEQFCEQTCDFLNKLGKSGPSSNDNG